MLEFCLCWIYFISHYLSFSISSPHSYLAVPNPYDFLSFVEQKREIFKNCGCSLPLQWQHVDAFKDAKVPQKNHNREPLQSLLKLYDLFMNQWIKYQCIKGFNFGLFLTKLFIECIVRVQKTYYSTQVTWASHDILMASFLKLEMLSPNSF